VHLRAKPAQARPLRHPSCRGTPQPVCRGDHLLCIVSRMCTCLTFMYDLGCSLLQLISVNISRMSVPTTGRTILAAAKHA
jgi:hypothetical protein